MRLFIYLSCHGCHHLMTLLTLQSSSGMAVAKTPKLGFHLVVCFRETDKRSMISENMYCCAINRSIVRINNVELAKLKLLIMNWSKKTAISIFNFTKLIVFFLKILINYIFYYCGA